MSFGIARSRFVGLSLCVVTAWLVTPVQAQFLQQGPKLVAPRVVGTIGQVLEGSSVALSADGNTALVGGDEDSNSTGAVWVWTRSGGVWTQGPKLVASGGMYQGTSVALSADGNTALVGGLGMGVNMGAAWVWIRSNGAWTQQGPELVVTGTGANGTSVALSADGNTALVGGPSDNGNVGAAWVWTRSGDVWTQGPKLVGTGAVPDPAQHHVLQGYSVALSGDGNTAMVGAPSDNNIGAVWVWIRSSGVWIQQGSKLVGTSGIGASQGSAVALSADGNTAIVGGNLDDLQIGALWAWTRVSGVWTQQGPKLISNLYSPSAWQGFSAALSADGNTAVVGAPDFNPILTGPGNIVIWTRNAGVWSQQGTPLTGMGASAQGNGVLLGWSVALSADGSTILAGGPNDNGQKGAAWAWVLVPGAPLVTLNPMSQTLMSGSTVVFTAAAVSTPAPTVQWQVSTDGGVTFNNIPGATSSTYSFTVNASQNSNKYRAVFTNSVASAPTAAAFLFIGVPTLFVYESHGGNFHEGQQGATYQINVQSFKGTTSGTVTVTQNLPSGLTLVSMAGPGWTCPGTAPNNCTRDDSILSLDNQYPPITVTVDVATDAKSPQVSTVTVTGGGAAPASSTDSTIINLGNLGFFPLTPCRAVDTRPGHGKAGTFGAALSSNVTRDFSLLSLCGIPISAEAFVTNITAVPYGTLNYLGAWPTGQYADVSTLNSPDGSVVANGAILAANNNGSVTMLASDQTDVIIDTTGYFAPANGQELAFYLIPPCRVADTRVEQGKTGAFGPPALKSYVTRDFSLASSGCGIPNTAQAYSLNVTAVPDGPLGFLSIWPAGEGYPGVSTLNSDEGYAIANATIMPAGNNGSITVLASNPTDLIIDASGYFAPAGGVGALHFYAIQPCRSVDTRSSSPLSAYTTRNFTIQGLQPGNCGIPSSAAAYSLNVTAVPRGSLDFLSVWPAGQPFPGVSTLNSPSGTVIANSAIVAAGAGGAITVVAGKPTDVIIDVNGYFAP